MSTGHLEKLLHISIHLEVHTHVQVSAHSLKKNKKVLISHLDLTLCK